VPISATKPERRVLALIHSSGCSTANAVTRRRHMRHP
jgi:hypothetical protein